MDQPLAALDMITRFIENRAPFAHSEEEKVEKEKHGDERIYMGTMEAENGLMENFDEILSQEI